MKFWFTLSVALVALMALPRAAPAREMFPARVIESVWWNDLVEDEPTLWRPNDRKGFKTRIRLSISGISTLRVLVRIDERSNGRAVGRVVLIRQATRDSDAAIDLDQIFSVSAAQMATLHARIAEANLWTFDPEEHWGNDDVCIDGEQLVFERRTAEGYRFSEANAQCTAPPALRAVARMMIELSGQRRGLGLLG